MGDESNTPQSDKEKQADEEEYIYEIKNREWRARCKLILIGLAIVGFVLQIIIFPLLSLLSLRYGWGIDFPQINLSTISILLSNLF